MSDTAVARVVLKGMGAHRGPGAVKAIVYDGANIGASTYRDSGGEFHMTLPANHPAAGACEPWLTHYSLQEFKDGAWKERFAGLISDFDATDDDVVVYGIDYLALLDLVIDSRYEQGAPKKPPPEGSYHSDTTLSKVIINLIDYARGKANSPVDFIGRGAFATFKEGISIYSTFVSIGPFVQGLVLSHRQGTGKRSRLYVQRQSDGDYVFRLEDNPGVERPNLRMEYGGLVQGFQIIGFGQFATVAHGIGRTQTGGELFYRRASSPAIDPARYGAIETVQFHDNVSGANDLTRRVKQHAAQTARVGKRMAMGIKVEGLSPFDGYGICDMIPVKVKRNIIDTDRYGSGWWAIHGVEWRIFPDGHTELTLAILPREDKVAPDANLLVDQEVLPTPLPAVIEDGSITSAKLATDPPAVARENIQPLAIDASLLDSGAVTQDALADGAVTDAAVSDISADKITGGTLGMGSGEDNADGMVVYDTNGVVIGTWTEDGLVLADPSDPNEKLRLQSGVIEFWDEATSTWLPAVTAEGITADAITMGTVPGGHNRIPNAGFEMAAFSTPSAKVWDVAADWGTTIGTDVNVVKTGADLTLFTSTY